MQSILQNDIFKGGALQKSAGLSFKDKLKNLVQTPTKQLLYNIQYNSLSVIIGIFLSSLLDYCFPVYDAEKGVSTLMVEVIIQTIFLSIVIYYIPKISKLVPYLGDNNYNFILTLFFYFFR